MLCKTTLLILSLIIVITSSSEATLTKTLFYLDPFNTFTQPFFQTKNNVIAYNVEYDNNPFTTNLTQTPQFYTLNLQNSSATPFFQDTMTACGHFNATYVRMFYHSDTSTLVYYCTKNNTLLILDEDHYTVKNQVQVTTTRVFNETKLYAEGPSVVILGMGTPFIMDTVHSELIKINLETLKVVRQVTFDKNLAAGEVVTAYTSTSTNLLSFVLTTLDDTQNMMMTLTIYNAIFVGNTYKLTPLTTFDHTYDEYLSFGYNPSELYCLGAYIVTNDNKNLLFYNVAGNLAYSTYLNFISQGPTGQSWLNLPSYAMQHGSSNLYANTLNGVTMFTANGQNLTQKFICTTGLAYLVSFVLGNQYSNDLVFSTDTVENDFNIIDPSSLEVLYSTPNYFSYKGSIDAITNSSYFAVSGGSPTGIATFDLKTNLLLGYLKEEHWYYFYEEVEQVYYYMAKEEDENECTIKYYDPHTFVTGFVYSYNEGFPCKSASFKAVEASDTKFSPNFVILINSDSHNSFLIHTQTYDHITVNWPIGADYGWETYVIANFDTMKMYYIRDRLSSPYFYNVNTYIFSQQENDFILQNSYNLSQKSMDHGLFAQIDSDTIALAPYENCLIINLSDGKTKEYTVPRDSLFGSISVFKDAQNKNHLILSNDKTIISPSYMLDFDGTETVMPESNNYTLTAGSGTGSRFWLLDTYPASIDVLRFYDSLSERQNAMPQQQQQQEEEQQQQRNIFDIFDILQ